jgi:peptidoglycan/LPS O-acetylase OafA/YrhL
MATFIVAAISYRFIETPFLRLKHGRRLSGVSPQLQVAADPGVDKPA